MATRTPTPPIEHKPLDGPSTRRNLWIPDGLWAEFEKRAPKKGLTTSELVRRAMGAYLSAMQRNEARKAP